MHDNDDNEEIKRVSDSDIAANHDGSSDGSSMVRRLVRRCEPPGEPSDSLLEWFSNSPLFILASMTKSWLSVVYPDDTSNDTACLRQIDLKRSVFHIYIESCQLASWWLSLTAARRRVAFFVIKNVLKSRSTGEPNERWWFVDGSSDGSS